jgi:Protein of unknown function (DUF2971)
MTDKILRVYHFVGREHGLDDIRRRRLKIATINDLNDPFELLGPSAVDREARRRFQQLKDQLARSRGMLCFSRNWKNPVQWSHYADKHKGLCLGFDIAARYVHPVTYSAKRLPPNIEGIESGKPEAEETMLKVLSTKYSHWRYEREMRCYLTLKKKDPDNGLYFYSFSNDLILREVIVGACSTVIRNELSQTLGDLQASVTTFKACLALGSFTVVRQQNESLWK